MQRHALVFSCALAAGTPVAAQIEFPTDARTIAVPVERALSDRAAVDAASGLMFVKVRVREKELSFLFDTGAGTCVLDTAIAKSMALEKTGQVNALGSGGAVPASTYTLDELQLMTSEKTYAVARDVMAIELDLKAIASITGRPIDGIVGSAIFGKNAFTLDLEKERIVVHRAGSFTPPEGASEFKMMFAVGVPCIRLALPGMRSRWFMVDTGNMATLLLHGPFVGRSVEPKALETLPSMASTGIGKAASRAYLARLEAVDLGAMKLRDVPVILCDPDQPGLMGNRSLAGNIGAGLLSRGRWSFDFARSRCWVEASNEERKSLVIEPSVGIHFRQRRGDWFVGKVLSGSPAEVAGIVAGDRIVEIDGEAAPKNLAKLLARLRAALKDDGRCRVVRSPRSKKAEAQTSEVSLRLQPWLRKVELKRKRVRR